MRIESIAVYTAEFEPTREGLCLAGRGRSHQVVYQYSGVVTTEYGLQVR